ncbi:hypothetical protein QNI16_21700 [Cytophagaceae bacterium YF14B1]|uniref:Uncharacterized protein n=1 Tax=Xanthocytophaga flava TaxID=3048013 RepID=A0AAE3QV69_9BACT|nr:hypothetical protein [Xanthocytophaga flavus]MDJ1483128.1 hypothetical protein [Xanthocytophaga flavus]
MEATTETTQSPGIRPLNSPYFDKAKLEAISSLLDEDLVAAAKQLSQYKELLFAAQQMFYLECREVSPTAQEIFSRHNHLDTLHHFFSQLENMIYTNLK